MIEWVDEINLTASHMVIWGSLVVFVCYSALFYLRHARQFEYEYQTLSDGEFNWLIWPAVAANYFFELLFGQRGTRFRDLYKPRTIGVVFLISLLANSMCVILILLSAPKDLPSFDSRLIWILVLSYLVFIIFNFLGDLISVNITRHVLSKIIAGKCNFIRYLGIDIFGIGLGYFVTLLPSLIIFIWCWNTGEEFNRWVRTGLMGNALIPFFLFIFATSKMPVPFAVFASIAVFSVTIPTLMYLFFMGFSYLCYRIYCGIWKNRDLGIIDRILTFFLSTGKLLLFLAPLLAAAGAIFRFY